MYLDRPALQRRKNSSWSVIDWPPRTDRRITKSMLVLPEASARVEVDGDKGLHRRVLGVFCLSKQQRRPANGQVAGMTALRGKSLTHQEKPETGWNNVNGSCFSIVVSYASDCDARKAISSAAVHARCGIVVQFHRVEEPTAPSMREYACPSCCSKHHQFRKSRNLYHL